MRLCMLIALGCGFVFVMPPGLAKEPERLDLTGVWIITEIREGVDRPETEYEGGELVVAGSRMALGTRKSEDHRATIVRFRLGNIDGKTTFDLIVIRDGKEVLMPGICRVADDQLELCCGKSVRPDTFTGGAGRVLIRAKKHVD